MDHYEEDRQCLLNIISDRDGIIASKDRDISKSWYAGGYIVLLIVVVYLSVLCYMKDSTIGKLQSGIIEDLKRHDVQLKVMEDYKIIIDSMQSNVVKQNHEIKVLLLLLLLTSIILILF